MTFAPATEKQVKFLNDLAAKRVVPTNVLADIEAAEAGLLAKADASNLIDLLKGFPFARRTETPAVTTQAPAVTVRDIPSGIFTIADGSGHTTLKVTKNAEWCDGKTVISYLFGSDNEMSYKGFAFVTTSGVKVWKKFADNGRLVAAAQFLMTGSLDEARENFLNLAEAYALRSGNCMACGRTLTVPASLNRGLGPICAQNLGV